MPRATSTERLPRSDYGTPNRCGENGDGTVFKLDSSGSLTTLHRFNGSDGACPYASLVLDGSGNLYGTTAVGGAGGYGTVFKLDGSASLTTLHSFDSSDGAIPLSSLVLDSSGNLYGTTSGTYASAPSSSSTPPAI